MKHLRLRQAILDAARALNETGLACGTSGNVGARIPGEGFLVTPSGLEYKTMRPGDIVEMDLIGNVRGAGNAKGALSPSSEWRFYRDIFYSRPEIGAIVHTHSPFATTLACLGEDIPAFHYMVAVAGGSSIRCAPYATFGSQALSNSALTALKGRFACLLANHGMIATGTDPKAALRLAVEVEALAGQYWRALAVGTPKLLSAPEMRRVVKKFAGYGKQPG
jgi:L-fuculose-phosphate aldolase